MNIQPTAVQEQNSNARVYNLGYEGYKGTHSGRMQAFYALYKDTILQSLGIGRVGKEKIIPWFCIALIIVGSITWIFFNLLFNSVQQSLGSFIITQEYNYSNGRDLYGWIGFSILIFVSAVCAEMFCVDRRQRILVLYFVRPVDRNSYILARLSGIATLCFVFAFVPQIIAFTAFWLQSDSTASWFGNSWQAIPRLLIASAAIAIFYSTVALLVGSIINGRTYSALVILVIYYIGYAVKTAITTINSIIGSTEETWYVFLHPLRYPVDIADIVLRLENQDFALLQVIIYFLLIPLLGGLAFWRYRRMQV